MTNRFLNIGALIEIHLAFLVGTDGKKRSVIIGFNQVDAGGGAKNAINLLHEIFNNFLMEGPYQNYMLEVFNVPEE